MKRLSQSIVNFTARLDSRFLPFADIATPDLPLGRLFRLSLFQLTVGMAAVLVIGTLNRVMIVEMHVPAWLVALMVALPLMLAPLRTVIGFKSDHHRSALGWRRVPYIWMGTMMQFGGLSIMPFALMVLSIDPAAPSLVGMVAAALAFLLVGAGMHTAQTVGLALAADMAPEHTRPRVVAMMCAMLMLGMVVSAILFGFLLTGFDRDNPKALVQVLQGAAACTMILNSLALWKQEPRDRSRAQKPQAAPSFVEAWRDFTAGRHVVLGLVAIGVGTMGFSMQDVLLEPYGGQVLGLPVTVTTVLSALLAIGGLLGYVTVARGLGRKIDAHRLAGLGILAGLAALSVLIASSPLLGLVSLDQVFWSHVLSAASQVTQDGVLVEKAAVVLNVTPAFGLFAAGTVLIGFGTGLFVASTLSASMGLAKNGDSGLALGTWGAVQATSAGIAIALGGIIRDIVSRLHLDPLLGVTDTHGALGYMVVYSIEIVLLFVALIAIVALVRVQTADGGQR